MTVRENVLRWSDPDERAVAEDALLLRQSEGNKGLYPPLPPYTEDRYYGGDGGHDYRYDGGSGGDSGDGDYNGNGNGNGDGHGNGGYGYGYGDGDGYGNGGYGHGGNGAGYDVDKYNHLRKESYFMREGLCIVVSPGGYSPYVRVGWCRRVEGDEWILVNARVIRRFGRDQQLVNLAENGPVVDKGAGENTILLDPAKKPSPIHRLHAIRCEFANEKAWAQACPRPQDWDNPSAYRE